MTAPIIEFENVRIDRGGRQVIDVPSLHVSRGLVTVVVGDNGSGKSTLLLAAAGLLNLASGRIMLDGKLFNDGNAPAPFDLRRKTALVLQEPYMCGGTVLKNVEAGLRYRGVEKETRRKDGLETLEKLGIKDKWSRKARELSGGQRKLVALAQAFAIKPEILFLDEPTANLDENFRMIIEEAIIGFSKNGGTAMMVCHDPAQIERMGQEIVRVRGGRASRIEQEQ